MKHFWSVSQYRTNVYWDCSIFFIIIIIIIIIIT